MYFYLTVVAYEDNQSGRIELHAFADDSCTRTVQIIIMWYIVQIIIMWYIIIIIITALHTNNGECCEMIRQCRVVV